jgi:hypothetical protein
MILGEYLGLRGMKELEAGGNCILMGSTVCTLQLMKSRRMRCKGRVAHMGGGI